ncbi:PH domain-like protein [Mytilinidion resinicola]|uniref:PH domain-like protein n=1 Tax=Mytilinidion resinicola TaxID=574789 RepID=A0A6A6YC16_9PEZI|nr:PH domain-like protein [Mytilinidion resinicola]KAF2806250.1 PH domain-like protein [Mytilinidion resinicola]
MPEHTTQTLPIPIPAASRQKPSMGMKIEPPNLSMRLNTVQDKTNKQPSEILSPVNQNGSFEFDRVLKSGTVLKRTRKTKSWKPIHLVLRPNLLSIYKDKDETKLRHQINLSEVTAVARQKDPKRKMDHVFGLFSPSRNFHIGAPTEKDAQEWVELIRSEARIDEEEEEMVLMSPGGARGAFQDFGRIGKREGVGSSSSEADPLPRTGSSAEAGNMHSSRRPSHTLINYSGNEAGSFSDFSDTPASTRFRGSSLSLNNPKTRERSAAEVIPGDGRSDAMRNVSQASGLGTTPDDERVIYHGWLYVLKSKGGVRQWKKLWVVLRPKSLGLYKNEEEYSANLIIPLSNIINAVEIDPVSRSKPYCMQIISDERNYRFCALSEDNLARWLGAFKSLFAKRKDAEIQRNAQPSSTAAAAPSALR